MDALVELIVGKLGGGKSYTAVTKILNALAAGEVVVTNLSLNWDACDKYLGRGKVPRSNYRHVSTAEIDRNPQALLDALPATGATLVLDEAHLVLNARQWKENMQKGQTFLSFLTQARKARVHCYLISQDERNMDSQMVRIATHVLRVINWQHLPVLGFLIPLPLIILRVCQPDGVTAIGREWIFRKKGVYACYDTRQKFSELALGGAEAAPVKGKRAKRMTYGAALICAGLACLIFDYAWTWKQRKRDAEKEAKKATAAVVAPVSVSAPAAGAASSVPAAKPLEAAPVEVTRVQQAGIELSLPCVWKLNGNWLTLVGGQRIYHGSFFLTGPVTGWRLEGGTVLLKIDSPEIKQVRLYYANGPTPFVYNGLGGVVRRSGRNGGSVQPGMAPMDSGVPQPGIGPSRLDRTSPVNGDGTISGPPGLGTIPAAGAYTAPAPFVPGKDTSASVFVPDRSPTVPQILQPSERVNAPANLYTRDNSVRKPVR